MKKVAALLLCVFSGCFYVEQNQVEDIILRPVEDWSDHDCLTVVAGSMRTNLLGRGSSNIQVLATPYTPAVVAALNRRSQLRAHWSTDRTQHEMDTLLAQTAGMYVNWENNRLVDSRGFYYRRPEQIPSLQFLVTLRNQSWPCNVPVQNVQTGAGYVMRPLMSPASWPCYLPDITDIDKRIFLINDQGVILAPSHVWGRNKNILTMEESLIVAFQLNTPSGHFLGGTKHFEMRITGFDVPVIQLEFPVSLFQFGSSQQKAPQ